jgi:hypothetical protein
MSLRRLNAVSSRASTSSSEYQPSRGSTSSSVISHPQSYASHASSDDGFAPDGSNATNPSLDIYENMEGITLEMASSTNILSDFLSTCAALQRNTNITESSRDVNHERNGKGPRYRKF